MSLMFDILQKKKHSAHLRHSGACLNFCLHALVSKCSKFTHQSNFTVYKSFILKGSINTFIRYPKLSSWKFDKWQHCAKEDLHMQTSSSNTAPKNQKCSKYVSFVFCTFWIWVKSSQFFKIDLNFSNVEFFFYVPHFPPWSTFHPRAWLMDSIKPSRSYLSSLTEILMYFSDTEVLFVLFLRYWQWRWCTLKVLILSSTDGLHPIGPYRYRACPGKLQDMCDVCKSNRLAPSWINSGWEWLFIQIRLLCVRLLRGFDIIYFVTLNFHIEFCHTETGWIRIIMVMVMIYLVGAAK